MSSGRILVTGANGFIAAYCIAELFAQKYAVVATVRSADKVAAVLAAHGHNPLLTTAIVPDLTRPDAFDDAITGCDGVLHLASPFTYDCTDVEAELLLPSIRGTEAICLAASKTPSVQRVVLTSSFAAVFDAAAGLAPGRVYTAQDWSPLTYEDGKAASDAPPVAYRASKKLAEDAAWQYVKRHQPHWDLVTLCPGMVFGPLWPGTLSSLGRLNESNSIIWGLVDAAAVPATKAPLWTAVTALAEAHVAALKVPEASNGRFLVINGNFDMQELVDIIHAAESVPAALKKRVPLGSPGERLTGKVFTADSSDTIRVLGVTLQDKLSDVVVDILLQLAEIESHEKP